MSRYRSRRHKPFWAPAVFCMGVSAATAFNAIAAEQWVWASVAVAFFAINLGVARR